jgi:hypothetical protein
MSAPLPSTSAALCQVHFQRGDHRCLLAFELREPYLGGAWVIDAPGFRLGIESADDLAASYTRRNWESGLISGARYAFRKLNRPLQRLGLHELTGLLGSDDMPALAHAAALGVATLLSAAESLPSPPELEGWSFRAETVAGAGKGPPQPPTTPSAVSAMS